MEKLFGASFTFILKDRVFMVFYTRLKEGGYNVKVVEGTVGDNRIIAQFSPWHRDPNCEHASAYLKQSINEHF